MNEKSAVQDFYEKNGRFPTDEETFELIEDRVDDFRDKHFMQRISEMFDKEYPGRIHCAWMIGSLSDRHNDPVIVHSSDIVDTTDQLYLGHKIYELTGMKTDIYTQSLLKAMRNPVAAARAGEYTPVLFYKRDSAHEPEIQKSRFSGDIPEDLPELLKVMFSEEAEPVSASLSKALDSMRDDFFKANGFIPTEEECVCMVNEIREEIRREKEERGKKE